VLSGIVIGVTAEVTIGAGVQMGVNFAIVDNDRHGLIAAHRVNVAGCQPSPIRIEHDVFPGIHLMVLKGVSIGRAVRWVLLRLLRPMSRQECWCWECPPRPLVTCGPPVFKNLDGSQYLVVCILYYLYTVFFPSPWIFWATPPFSPRLCIPRGGSSGVKVQVCGSVCIDSGRAPLTGGEGL